MSLTLELPESLQNRLENIAKRGGDMQRFALVAISTALDSLEETADEETIWWDSLTVRQQQMELQALTEVLDACDQGKVRPESEVFERIRLRRAV